FYPMIISVHGLYVVDLPNNVLYADDFENYTQGQVLGTGATGAATSGGWGFYDSDGGGVRDINNTSYWSCCKSLYLQSSTLTSGKFDVHRNVPTTNTTRLVTVSVYFAFSDSFRNRGGGQQMTISIETFDYASKYECVMFVSSQATTVTFGGPSVLYNLRLASVDGTLLVYAKNQWHHFTMTCDIFNKKYVSATLDHWDLTAGIAGQSMISIVDTEMIISGKPFTIPARIEFADVNDATHTLPTDTWWKWVDDLIVTDSTSGVTCGPLCLSAVNLSAWFGILMVTVGAGTSSSLYFGAARMLRGEPFKSKEVVALMFAGVLGVLAFGVMMAVAVGLIKIIPGG